LTCNACVAGKWRLSSLNNNLFDQCVDSPSPQGGSKYWISSGTADGSGIVVLCSVATPDCDQCEMNGLNCGFCKPGFYVFESKSGTICVRCDEPGLLIRGFACQRCAEVFPNCQRCQSNQDSPSKLIICQTCQSGFALRVWSAVESRYQNCETCQMGEFEKVTNTGESFCELCSNAITGCSKCSNGGQDCLVCDASNSLFKNPNGRWSCVNCLLPIYFLKGSKTPDCEGDCCLCTVAIENCLECKGDINTCSKCQEGYLLHSSNNNGVFDTCVPCKEPNQIRNEKQLLTSGLAVCDHCSTRIANCKDCYGNSDHCLMCNHGFYRTASLPGGNYDACTPCTQNGFYPDGEANGLGYCQRCIDIIPGCQSCNGKSCSKCIDPLFLSSPSNDSCIECLGLEDSRNIDEETGLAVCHTRPVAKEIIGFVSKDQSIASLALGCNEAGFFNLI
jgi:hypothetical protein